MSTTNTEETIKSLKSRVDLKLLSLISLSRIVKEGKKEGHQDSRVLLFMNFGIIECNISDKIEESISFEPIANMTVKIRNEMVKMIEQSVGSENVNITNGTATIEITDATVAPYAANGQKFEVPTMNIFVDQITGFAIGSL